MGRILKALFLLVILAALAVVGYAYFGDMDAERGEQRIEINLNAAGNGG